MTIVQSLVVILLATAFSGTVARAADGDGDSTAMERLFIGIRESNLSLVQSAILAGAKVNKEGRTRETDILPLKLAVSSSTPEIVQALLAAGANPDTATRAGEDTPIHRAIERKPRTAATQQIFEALWEKSRNRRLEVYGEGDYLSMAGEAGCWECMPRMLEAGLDPNGKGERDGFTPLMRVALAPAGAVPAAVVQSLLDHPRIKLDRVNAGSVSALHFAANTGNIDLVKRLLDKGLPVDGALPDRSTTPLMSAILGGNVETVRLLLEKGASITRKDGEGDVPMCFVRSKERRDSTVEIARLLVAKGADVNQYCGGEVGAVSTFRPGYDRLQVATVNLHFEWVDYIIQSSSPTMRVSGALELATRLLNDCQYRAGRANEAVRCAEQSRMYDKLYAVSGRSRAARSTLNTQPRPDAPPLMVPQRNPAAPATEANSGAEAR